MPTAIVGPIIDRKELMSASAAHRSVAAPVGLAALLGGALILAGCTSPSTPTETPATKPSASVAPVVRFVVPAEMNGVPRSTDDKWLKIPKSEETALKRDVLSPTGGSLAAAYVAPDHSEVIEIGAAAGRVVNPAWTLRQLQSGSLGQEDVRPADPGTAGGVGSCGVSRDYNPPLVLTVCVWAEPGSVGSVRFMALKDRRDKFAKVRAQLQP